MDEEKVKLERDIKYLTQQILALGDLHSDFIRERNRYPKDSYDFALLDREKSKVDRIVKLYEKKLRTRNRILQGERVTFTVHSESEDSDGGYSEIEGFFEEQSFIQAKIRKRKVRQPKPNKEDFDRIAIERRERERRENYLRRQEQIANQVNQQVDSSDSEEEFQEFNMANQLRWSVQSVSKFHGESGQSATQHLYEFDDFLRAARIEVPNPADGQDELDVNVSHIINDFVTTLKGKARIWYDMNVPVGERTTKRHWNAIRNKFQAYFHPLGSTKEQRIRAWKDMKWDPIKEAIDDFAYRYKELGHSLGLADDSIFDNFKACIPGQYFVFVYNANDMTQAVDNLKKCIAAGPMVPTTTVNPTIGTTQLVTQRHDKLKFMTMAEEVQQNICNQLHDMMDERLVPMEEGMSETRDMIDQIYQMMSQGQQNQGQMRFNQGQGQGQMSNRFGQYQNKFNKGRSQTQNFQNFGQKRGGQSGQNGFNRNSGNNREVFCTFCKKYRHQVANCIALKNQLRRRGYRIANTINGFGNGFNGGQRQGNGSGRGGSNGRGGRNGSRFGNRTGFQDRVNCMNQDEVDEDYDNDMNDDELFMCCVSEFQENTGLEVVPQSFDESN